jgi:glycosyltransferase involved in cell wall biosynthesis
MYFGTGSSTIVRGRIAPFLDDVDALWVSTEPVPPEFPSERLRVKVLPRRLLRRLPRQLYFHTADYVLEVLALVHRFRPHLIHVHYVSQLDAVALLGVRRVPLMLTVMGADVLADQIPRPKPLDLLVRRLFRRATAVTAKSSFLEARCRDMGARADRVHRIPWGVDTSHFAPADRAAARKRLALPEAAPLLVSSRTLQPIYNHEHLVDAVGRLDKGNRPRVVFSRNAADPSYAALIAKRAADHSVDATFLDPLAPEDMPHLYAAADACVSIPSSDGLPQTVLEALSCERPTLALDLEAYAELPFAPDALVRVAHTSGQPQPTALKTGLETVLAATPRAGLSAARAWIQEHAELARSEEAIRELYTRIARTDP